MCNNAYADVNSGRRQRKSGHCIQKREREREREREN